METFIPTVVFNSPFASQSLLVKGKLTDTNQLMPLTYVGHTHSPKILTETDLAAVRDSRKMFARQIVSDYSDGLKSMIDAKRNPA